MNYSHSHMNKLLKQCCLDKSRHGTKLLSTEDACAMTHFLHTNYKLNSNGGNFPYYTLNSGCKVAEVMHIRNRRRYFAITRMSTMDETMPWE